VTLVIIIILFIGVAIVSYFISLAHLLQSVLHECLTGVTV